MAKRLGYLFVCLSVILRLGVQGFFIDLETLGISTSKGDDTETDSSDLSKTLIAAPSETQPEYVEIDSKTDPNKSVRLTIEELKALILGSVKDITSKPTPINIKISTESRKANIVTTPNPPQQQRPASNQNSVSSVNKYKYQPLDSYSNNDDEDESSYWNPRPSDSETDYKSNEVTPSSGLNDENGFLSVAKAVIRGPTKIMNSYSKSFNRWSGSKNRPKPKNKPYRRPIADITYQHQPERRRRRKNKPQQRRNHRPRQRPRRRYQRPQSYYYDDDDVDAEYYEDNYQQQQRPSYSSYSDAWDRMAPAHEEFDSNVPSDMIPPIGPTNYY